MFRKPLTTALVASLSFAALSALITPAFAEIINNDIIVSEEDLEKQCDDAGGTFTKYPDRSYGCIIHKPDGTLVTVACDVDLSCFGTSGIREDDSDRRPQAQTGGTVVQGTAAPRKPVKRLPLLGSARVEQ